jgi:hypothetical protein
VVFDGAPFALSAASSHFREVLSLDPARAPALPNLAIVQPALIGPITDLLTFYSDLWLAQKVGHLQKVGDHLYHEYGTPSAWGLETLSVLGEDSIDFDITLTNVDQSAKAATLLIRHVRCGHPWQMRQTTGSTLSMPAINALHKSERKPSTLHLRSA